MSFHPHSSGIGLPLSYVIGLGILSQLSSILSLKLWGGYADNYSNKTIIAIGAPLYIVCIVGWCFVGQSENFSANIILLSVINIITGFATAGINLSLTNIGLKLAPKQDAIVYLSAKNIVTALFSSIAPVFGGWLADILANNRLNWTLKLKTPEGMKELHVIALGQWNFLFLIGALLALFSIKLLKRVQETGEVEKTLVVKVLRSDLRNSLKENFVVSYLINWPVTVSARIKKLSFSSDKSKAEETKRA